MSDTRIDEVGERLYRISTWMEPPGMVFNQYLLDGDEPVLFHLGHRSTFEDVAAAVATVVPVERLRWLSFGHYEADECGSMNSWLSAAPDAEVVHGLTGVLVSLGDAADRPPRALGEGEVLDVGGHRLRWIGTPHVPHGWDAGVMFDETTSTLMAGDLFTQTGRSEPLSSDSDLLARAIATEDLFGATALTATTGSTIRSLADLAPERLALMHGPAFEGDCSAMLAGLADDYERRLAAASL